MASASLAYRGRLLGLLLMLLGIWAALIPLVGPYFGFAFTPDRVWMMTSGRLWLSVAPGAAAFIGGLLVASTDRAATPGAFLAALAGTWLIAGQNIVAFVVPGRSITTGSPVIDLGAPFRPSTMIFLERLGFFYGLGIVILFFAALALGEIIVARMAALRYRDRLDAIRVHQGEFDRTS
jgi:hypothetical protein